MCHNINSDTSIARSTGFAWPQGEYTLRTSEKKTSEAAEFMESVCLYLEKPLNHFPWLDVRSVPRVENCEMFVQQLSIEYCVLCRYSGIDYY